jgi:hypothetical protein
VRPRPSQVAGSAFGSSLLSACPAALEYPLSSQPQCIVHGAPRPGFCVCRCAFAFAAKAKAFEPKQSGGYSGGYGHVPVPRSGSQLGGSSVLPR